MDLLAMLGSLIVALLAATLIAFVNSTRLRRWLHGVVNRPESEFPVRFTCRHETDFDPESGYHEGLHFEVFNCSDKPVRIKGFGLKLWMSGPGSEWLDREQARQHPPIELPAWLRPNDGLEGYLDYECLGEELRERGMVGETKPYVDVFGFGEHTAEVIPEPATRPT